MLEFSKHDEIIRKYHAPYSLGVSCVFAGEIIRKVLAICIGPFFYIAGQKS